MPERLPISAVIATRNRSDVLERTLVSLSQQTALPEKILIVDASDEFSELSVDGLQLRHLQATSLGAAAQRDEGIVLTSSEAILFMDDDVLLEPDCINQLWNALQEETRLGGVSSMITNQAYSAPGTFTRIIVKLIGGYGDHRDAGAFIGGVRNALPADIEDLPEVQPVEWLNTTCTLYRREALPSPAFPVHFTGASVCEDLALSLVVAHRGWKLANSRLARIFHDSQGGDHKTDLAALTAQEFQNRAYILRRILGDGGRCALLRLLISQGYEALAAGLSSGSPSILWARLRGIGLGLSKSRLRTLPPLQS